MSASLETAGKAAEIASFLWERGGAFLWAIAISAICAMCVLLSVSHFGRNVITASNELLAWLTVAATVFFVLAIFKTIHENQIETLKLVGDEQNSYWKYVTLSDGRVATEVALKLRATNISKTAILPVDIRLMKPHERYPTEKSVLTRCQGGNGFDPENEIPGGNWGYVYATIFINRPIGKQGKRMWVTAKLSDQFGRWHKIRISLRFLPALP